MTRRELEKLLGGYAAGTLTPGERDALFAAAIEDQGLFDALAREEALRDLLAEPAARERLLAALEEPRPHPAARLVEWMRRPRGMALAAGVAAAMVAIAVLVPRRAAPPESQPVEIAQARPPAAAVPEPPREAAEPAPAPVPRQARTARPLRLPEPKQAPQLEAAPEVAAAAPPAPQHAPPAPPPPPPAAVADSVAAAPPLRRAVDATERRELSVRTGAAAGYAGMEAREKVAAPAARTMALARDEAAPPLRYSLAGTPRAGEPFGLRFESREPGWVYVFTADSQGWRFAAGTKIDAGRPSTVPLHFDEPGRRELLAVLSRTEHPDLQAGRLALPPAAAATLRIVLEVAR